MKRVEDAHDPGGKVRIKVAEDVAGDALFSPDGTRRLLLTRSYPEGEGTAFWIGMNPSTAAAEVDDPTVRRESDFSRLWGYARFAKANVMDYRATSPKDLLAEGVDPRGPDNLRVIREQAAEADLIMLAFGALHPKLVRYGEETVEALRKDGRTLFCLGLTKHGAPRHPLYMRKDCKPIPF